MAFLRNRAFLGILLAIVIGSTVAVLVAYYLPQQGNSAQYNNTRDFQLYAYSDSAGFHFLLLGWDQFGQPESGFVLNFTFSTPSNTYSSSGTTNSSGISLISSSAPLNDPNYTFFGFSVAQPGGAGVLSQAGSDPFLYAKRGQVLTLAAPIGTITSVIDSKNPNNRDILVTGVAPFGLPPAGYQVYYEFRDINSPCSTLNCVPASESGMQLLGTLSFYGQVFHVSERPAPYSSSTQLIVAVFYPNGTSTNNFAFFLSNEIYPSS